MTEKTELERMVNALDSELEQMEEALTYSYFKYNMDILDTSKLADIRGELFKEDTSKRPPDPITFKTVGSKY